MNIQKKTCPITGKIVIHQDNWVYETEDGHRKLEVEFIDKVKK